MLAIQIVTYACVALAALAIAAKVYKYATAPTGMRWELYPVPHERGRSTYGGSYVEELDWWTKPRNPDKVNELKEMASEVFLLKGVHHHNKKVWRRSFPFHLGLYLAIGWLGLLVLGALVSLANIEIGPAAGFLGSILHYLTVAVGYAGLGLTCLGAIGLLQWRLTDKDQQKFNAPIDYVNLLCIIAATGFALAAHLIADPAFAAVRGYTYSLITFSTPALPNVLLAIEVVLGSLLIAFITVTRMSHFVAKYFLYHAVRWNDEPNERGSKIEAAILKNLERKVGWNAAHIQTGETWGKVVTEYDK